MLTTHRSLGVHSPFVLWTNQDISTNQIGDSSKRENCTVFLLSTLVHAAGLALLQLLLSVGLYLTDQRYSLSRLCTHSSTILFGHSFDWDTMNNMKTCLLKIILYTFNYFMIHKKKTVFLMMKMVERGEKRSNSMNLGVNWWPFQNVSQ